MIPALILTLLPLVCSLRYSARNAGLTSVPRDIPPETTHLDLSYNDIRNVSAGAFAHIHQLEELHICANKLTDLPELNGIGDTLKFLALDSNDIVEIDQRQLKSIVNLEKLSLIDNKLLTFPNLTAIGRTLKVLHLYNNNIQKINPDFVVELATLQELGLSKNTNLKLFPSSTLKHLKLLSLDDCDMEYVPSIWTSDVGALTVSVRRGSLKLCSCMNLWLKQAQIRGATILIDDVVCGGKKWSSHSTASLLSVCD